MSSESFFSGELHRFMCFYCTVPFAWGVKFFDVLKPMPEVSKGLNRVLTSFEVTIVRFQISFDVISKKDIRYYDWKLRAGPNVHLQTSKPLCPKILHPPGCQSSTGTRTQCLSLDALEQQANPSLCPVSLT